MRISYSLFEATTCRSDRSRTWDDTTTSETKGFRRLYRYFISMNNLHNENCVPF